MIPKFLTDTDEGTWVGHFLQGLAGFWLGYLPCVWLLGLPKVAAMGAGILAGFLVIAFVFAHREGDNLLEGFKKYGMRLAVRRKGLDGLMDWLMPVLASFCDINLILGGFTHFAVSLLASAGVWLFAALSHNGKDGIL